MSERSTRTETFICALICIVSVFAVLFIGASVWPQEKGWHDGINTPCITDDGEGGPCYWDAQTMGDHTGHSYYVDADGTLHYK